MKNFTNNFKQFTSRLSARWLIMALMLLVGTSSAWATIDVYPGETIIIDVSSHSWFNNDNCYPKLYCGNTVIGQASGYESDKKYEITLTITSVVNGTLHVSRCNSNGEYNKQYIDDRSSSKINTFKITGDGNGKWNTTQSSTNIYYLRGLGDFDKWNNIKNPYTIYLNKGDYEFKIYDSNDNWYGNDGTMTRDNCSGWTMETGKNNCKITADVAGDYTFTFDASTKKLTVTYPELPCYTLSDVDPGTISSNATNNAICGSGSVELTLSNTTSKDGLTRTIQWQKYNGSAWSNISNATATTYTETVFATTKYRAKVTWAKSGCNDLVEYSSENGFTITVNARPAAPTFDAIPAQCGSYTLPAKDKNKVNVNWYTAATGGEKITSVNTTSAYYAEAVDGTCISASRTPVQITINTKPTISISGNNSPVLYEDVELTATTDGTSISWEITGGDGSLSSTTGNPVTLTSSSAGNVTVTATATLGSCTATDTHEVEFSAENCADVPSKNIQITFTHPANNQSTGQWWGMGKMYSSSGTELKDMGCNTSGSTTFTLTNVATSTISVYFEACYDWGYSGDNTKKATTKDSKITLYRGKKYSITITNGNIKATATATETGSLTDAPPISAPAAKTISVSTTDGEGNIIFSGQVVKTGCDATNEYGFQYSSDEQTWTTVKVGENAVAGTAISNNTVNGLDGTYYVRAYITNDNSTQYGEIKEITVSTEKDPITTVELTHVRNQAGDPYSKQELENLIYCVGDIVWFKLEQDGSNFQYYEWISYPGTGLEGMYYGGMFKLKITRSGNVGIRLRNDANVDGEGNPTWVESNLLWFNTHPEPTAPTISFATATICSNDAVGATLTLGATVSGQAYELWKYANDDDTEGSKVANVATLNCTENNQELQFTGIKTAGKYFVKTYYTEFCNTVTANSSYATLTVVNAEDVSISINPATATTTPWMPVKLTISATDDYTLEVPEGVEFSQNGNICSVKIPLPDGATGGEGQYENVSFPQNATTSYTVTANLVSTGGENNPCAVPATATITLTPYVEECTEGH